LYKSKLPRPYIDYTRLLLKVSIFRHVMWYILYKNNGRYIYTMFICCLLWMSSFISILLAIITNITNIYR
jgi:hypothetical protein